MVLATWKMIILEIPKSAFHIPKKGKERKRKEANNPVDEEFVIDEDDPKFKEVWSRKPKKQKTYFEKKFLELVSNLGGKNHIT